MKLRNQKLTDTSGAKGGPITRENYHARFKAHAASEWFTIRRPEGGQSPHWAEVAHTPAQWHAWMVWFGFRHIPTKVFDVYGVVSVPSEWPEQFDPEVGASDHQWRPAPKDAVERNRLAAVQNGFDQLQAKVGFPNDKRAGLKNFRDAAERAAAEETIAKHKEEWKKPVEASGLLLKSLGLPPRAPPPPPEPPDMGDEIGF